MITTTIPDALLDGSAPAGPASPHASPPPPSRRPFRPRIVLSLVAMLLAAMLLSSVAVDAKRRSGPSRPPDLRILNVAVTPESYSPTSGPLELTVEVELPAQLGSNAILEVSSLISSPSKRSMRFLSSRQPVDLHEMARATSDAAEGQKPRMAVRLTWDGTDQTKQPVAEGRYDYEIRAKLLTSSEAGPPKTQMVSWPKRGTLVVEGVQP